MSTLSQFMGGGGLWKSQVFTASGTFPVPKGVGAIRVLLVGAGGGGYPDTYGGGGGGGEIVDRIIPVSPSTSYPVTIAPTTAAGSNGLSSTFGSILTARGGKAGTNTRGGAGGGCGTSGFAVSSSDTIYEFSNGGFYWAYSDRTEGMNGISSGTSISGGGGGSENKNGGNVIGFGTGGLAASSQGGGGASYGNGANGAAAAQPNTGGGGGGGAGGQGGSGICIVYWVE